MNTVNSNVRIIILGTKRSLILSQDEEFEIIFKKGERLRDDLNDINDLIDNTFNQAYSNGDTIKSLFIDELEIIREQIEQSLRENNFSSDDTLIELSQLPQFYNADPADLYERISEVNIELKI